MAHSLPLSVAHAVSRSSSGKVIRFASIGGIHLLLIGAFSFFFFSCFALSSRTRRVIGSLQTCSGEAKAIVPLHFLYPVSIMSCGLRHRMHCPLPRRLVLCIAQIVRTTNKKTRFILRRDRNVVPAEKPRKPPNSGHPSLTGRSSPTLQRPVGGCSRRVERRISIPESGRSTTRFF